jgi:uncharacterized protein YutE (UPF0331/DUF86 family)
VFEVLAKEGVLTKDQVALLNDVYALEGRLEHASSDVDAEEVLSAVERFRGALPSLIEQMIDWLRDCGIEFR